MKSTLAPLLLLAAGTPALAVGPTLDFEGTGSFASVAAYYDGGSDGAGNVGPALGVRFGGDVLGLVNDALGPYFSNAPSPLGVMFAAGPEATMDVAGGFDLLSFHYASSAAVAGAVQVWSGLGATGTLLHVFDLAANAQAGGCSDTAYCNFSRLAASFASTAFSVSFAGAANVAVFDDVSPVPEPGTAAFALLGLGLLALRARRAA